MKALLIAALAAQASLPPFEVASIKPHVEGTSTSGGGFCSGPDTQISVTQLGVGGPATETVESPVSPGACRFRRTVARELIAAAYGVGRGEFRRLIVGGPAWLDTERFDLDAKADRLRPQAELQEMLQALLADRFRLRLHRETREVDGYALVVAARGSTLTATTSLAGSIVSGVGTMRTEGAAVDRLALALENRLGKKVVNATGLTGVYAFSLQWTPEDDELPLIPGAPPDLVARLKRGITPNGPSIFTALDEQLGLRLEPRKVPLPFLVIDAIERPSAN